VSAYAASGSGEIWVVDPGRHSEIRVTSEDRDNLSALWSPDGWELAVFGLSDTSAIYRVEVGRPRSERLWRTIDDLYSLESWLPDGKSHTSIVGHSPRSATIEEVGGRQYDVTPDGERLNSSTRARPRPRTQSSSCTAEGPPWRSSSPTTARMGKSGDARLALEF